MAVDLQYVPIRTVLSSSSTGRTRLAGPISLPFFLPCTSTLITSTAAGLLASFHLCWVFSSGAAALDDHHLALGRMSSEERGCGNSHNTPVRQILAAKVCSRTTAAQPSELVDDGYDCRAGEGWGGYKLFLRLHQTVHRCQMVPGPSSPSMSEGHERRYDTARVSSPNLKS